MAVPAPVRAHRRGTAHDPREVAPDEVIVATGSSPRRDGLPPVPVHLVGDVTGTNGIRPAIHQAAAVARAL